MTMTHEKLRKDAAGNDTVWMLSHDAMDLADEFDAVVAEIDRLRAENEKLRTERSDTCRWTRPNRYSECWDTKCGNSQVIADGTPSDEEWKFCPFCGKQIEEW